MPRWLTVAYRVPLCKCSGIPSLAWRWRSCFNLVGSQMGVTARHELTHVPCGCCRTCLHRGRNGKVQGLLMLHSLGEERGRQHLADTYRNESFTASMHSDASAGFETTLAGTLARMTTASDARRCRRISFSAA